MNLAALDLGSNSFHLLVARGNSTSELRKVASHKEMLRLGAVVQAHGRLPDAVFSQALAAVGTMASVARAFRAERIVAVATSALRSAENGREFVAAAAQQHRISVEMLSGGEEGALVYRGARSGLSNLPSSVCVVDIGGGSVEVAVGDADGCQLVESLPLGFLRLGQALDARGPSGAEAIRSHVLDATRGLARRLEASRPEVWIFSGGTARAFGKLLVLDGAELPIAVVRRVAHDVLKSSPERLRSLGVDPARAETLGLGVSVLVALIESFRADSIRISPCGLREGVLLRELQRFQEGSGLRLGKGSASMSA